MKRALLLIMTVFSSDVVAEESAKESKQPTLIMCGESKYHAEKESSEWYLVQIDDNDYGWIKARDDESGRVKVHLLHCTKEITPQGTKIISKKYPHHYVILEKNKAMRYEEEKGEITQCKDCDQKIRALLKRQHNAISGVENQVELEKVFDILRNFVR